MTNDPAKGYGEFRTTNWSLVGIAQTADDEAARREALAELLRRCYPALLAHLVLKRRHDHHRAEELLQGFIADKVLERDLIAHANQSKGRFRSLLLRSLENYVIDQIRRGQADKRSYGRTVPLDLAEPPAANDERDSEVFDAAWVHWVLGEALNRMRSDCEQTGRRRVWDVFDDRVVGPSLRQATSTSYEELAPRLGFGSPGQASNALITAKRQFKRILRGVLAEYAGGDAQVDDEWEALRRIATSTGSQGAALASARGGADFVSSYLQETCATDLANLFALDERPASPSHDEEMADALRNRLAAPLVTMLPGVAAELETHAALLGATQDPQAVTFLELLTHPAPPLTLLKQVKRFGRNAARNSTREMPGEVASVLYFAAIAAAMVRHDERISKSSDDLLRRGMSLVLSGPWLDPGIAELIRGALERLS